MRYLIFFLFASTLISACSRSTAGLNLPARQQFVLGEYEQRAYTASLNNRGSADVSLAVVDKTSKTEIRRLELPTGGKLRLEVDPTQEVRVYNTTDREANIAVGMSHFVEGMRTLNLDGSEVSDTPRTAAQKFPGQASATDLGTEHTGVISPGSRLIIGEATAADYSVAIMNRGGKNVYVSVRDKATGRQTKGFGLGRSATVRVKLSPTENLHLVNEGDKAATVKLEFSEVVLGARQVLVR